MRPPLVAFTVSTCAHCGEPILRPVLGLLVGDVWLRWLHTDLRDGCIDHLTREPIGQVAEPRRWPVPA